MRSGDRSGRSSANVGDIYIPFFFDETIGQRARDLGSRVTRLVVFEFQRDKDIRVYQGENERSQANKELIGTVSRLTEAVLTRSAEEFEEALQSWIEGNAPIVCPGTLMQCALMRAIKIIDHRPMLIPALVIAVSILLSAWVVYAILIAGTILAAR